MSRAKSGRIATFHIPLGTLQRSGYIKGTWDAANKKATFGTEGTDFWYHSDKYELDVKLNGVIAVPEGWVSSGATNSVIVKSFTYQIAGATKTYSTNSVGSLTPATSTGKMIVYAVCATAGGIYKLNTLQGTATTTRGAIGGPSYITTDGIVLFYVTRAYGAANVITTSEISLILYSGTEWVNPQNDTEYRPLKLRVDFQNLPGAIHTGDTYPHIYARGYSFANNFTKVGQAIDWKTGIDTPREDATEQGASRKNTDAGRRAHTFGASKFISGVPDEIFSNVNADASTDFIVKMFQDKEQTTKFLVAQIGFGADMDFPNADKQKVSITGEVTGHVEEIG